VLLVAASVSFTLPQSFEFVDKQTGQPALVYLVYNFQGQRLNPAHSTSYNATALAVRRTDDRGRIRIPGAFHVHLPFPIETHPSLRIAMIYAPGQHNGLGSIHAGTEPNVFEYDPERHRADIVDLSERPQRWEGTLMNLPFFLHQIVPFNARTQFKTADPTSAALTVELIGHFRQEYQAFLSVYRDVARPLPPKPAGMNEDETRRWKEMVDKDLSERPTWGPEIERLFKGEVVSLGEVEAELR
jgi:hypothetical protein